MNITVYEGFNKRRNSTLRPSGGVVISVALKIPTDINNPHFIFSSHSETNYIMWDNRYYFVDNKIYLDNNRVEVICTIDLLATYKSRIGAYSGFIARCSVGYDDKIDDPCCSYEDKYTHHPVRGSLVNGSAFSTTLTPVIQCMSSVDGKMALTCWKGTTGTLKALNELISIDLSEGSLSLANLFKETSIDPSRYVTKMFYVPWEVSTESSGETFNIAGCLPTTANATHIPDMSTHTTLWSFNLTSALSDLEPFQQQKARVKLFLPFYGLTEFSLVDYTQPVNVRVRYNDNTGDVAYLIENGGSYIAKMTVNASIEFSMGALSQKNALSGLTGAGASVLGVAGSLALGNPVGVVSNIMSFASNTISALTPTVNACGGISSTVELEIGTDVLCDVVVPVPKDIDYTSVCGRPCNEVGTVSSHGGFVQCAGASISLPMHSNEVSNLLNSGIYYE